MAEQFNPWANLPMQEAIPFGAGATPEGAPTALSGMLSGVMDIPKKFIDTASGFDPHDIRGSTERVTPAAAEMALALAGAGAPAAEAGAAGMFGGKLARGADLRALNEAEQMAAGGKNRYQIRSDTGWEQNPMDSKWRFEIPDNNMKLKYMPTTEGDIARGPMSAFVDHPEAFYNYPDLAKLGMAIKKDTSDVLGTGYYNPIHEDLRDFLRPHIEVNAPTFQTGRSVAAHELQHGIQDIEGFAFGASPERYARHLEEGMRSGGYKNYDLAELMRKANDFYMRTAGEAEARNVQHRLDMSPEIRKLIPSWETQDVPYDQQLLIEALKGFK